MKSTMAVAPLAVLVLLVSPCAERCTLRFELKIGRPFRSARPA
jgi:hypothetical protein